MNIKKIAISGDTYHNRYSKDSPYKGDDHYRKLPKRCAKCGTTKGPFDIHHKSGNRKSKSRSDLQVLCRSCHRKLHDGHGEYIVSTAARIIEDPKTKESEAIANSHKNSDLLHVEYILCHADANANKDEFLPEDLKESTLTAINKPINWEHKDKNIGTIYESKYVSVANLDDHEKEYYSKIDPLKKDFVVCRAAIWEYKHPLEARIMRERAANGTLFFSMENKFEKVFCSKCKEVFASTFEYCDHLLERRQKGDANRVFINSNFVGAAVTSNPADKDAGTLALAKVNALNFSIASLVGCKLMKDINIEDIIIPYIVRNGGKGMKVRKLDIPSEFHNDLVDLPDDAFADSINRVFPIDNASNIEVSAKLMLNNELSFYDKKEKLFLLENLANASREYEIDIADFIENEGGTETMIDKNSPEFKEALAEELGKVESGQKMKEFETKLADVEKAKADSDSKIAELMQEKQKVASEFEKFQKEIKDKEISEARMNKISEKNFGITKTIDYVKTAIANMDDNTFNSFLNLLVEVYECAEAKTKASFMTDEQKKKEEEKKKKEEEDKKAKAKVDPVKESEAAIANKVEDEHKDELSAVDKVLKHTLGLK